MADEEPPSYPEIVKTIRSEFEGNQTQVTVEMLADLYAVLAAQQEAISAIGMVAMKSRPSALFEPETVHMRDALGSSLETFQGSIMAFWRASGVAGSEDG